MRSIITIIFILLTVSLLSQTNEWQWAFHAGGSGYDIASDVVLDSLGYVYVTGAFEGTIQFGLETITSIGNSDLFVAKLGPDGSLIWFRHLGNNGRNYCSSITIDNDGSIFLTGYFSNSLCFGSTTLTSIGYWDIFVAKIDANGNWVWASQAGGSSYYDRGYDIVVDADGFIFVTGLVYGNSQFGAVNLHSSNNMDAFIAKLDREGNWLWATVSNGTGYTAGRSIAVDDAGFVYIIGDFQYSTCFGTITLIAADSDIFIAKLNPQGSWLWVVQVLDSDNVYGNWGSSIAVDSSGNIYTTGFFSSSMDFGATHFDCLGYRDIFVAKMDTNANWLWAKQAGGAYEDYGYKIAVDESDNIYVSGSYSGSVSFGNISLYTGLYNAYIACLDNSGNWLWVEHSGGNCNTRSSSIALDNIGGIYAVGTFNYNISFGTEAFSSYGDYDIFVAKLMTSNSSLDNTPEQSMNLLKLNAYPNPFASNVTISYDIQQKGNVCLNIYNIKGQLVKSLEYAEKAAGHHDLSWDGKDSYGKLCSSGVYFCKMQHDNHSYSKKLFLRK
jgi:hypothetical protein